MARSRRIRSCLLAVSTNAGHEEDVFGRSSSPSTAPDKCRLCGQCVFLMMMFCESGRFRDVASTCMDGRRGNGGSGPLPQVSGISSRDKNEYSFSFANTGFCILVNAAADLSISVFHFFSSHADEALSTNSKFSPRYWKVNFQENRHP